MRIIFKKIITGILLLIVFLSTSFSMYPEKAEAQFAVTDPLNLIQNIIGTISNVASEVVAYSDKYKEYVLDPIVSAFAKQMLRAMTGSIVNWINGGFNGSPSFIQNPGAFFLDVADQATGQFITGELKALCSPFSLDIRIALSFKYHPNVQKRYACTLSTIIKNTTNAVKNSSINGFTAGDFRQGGWPAFVSLTTEPQNNIYGAYLQADSDLSFRVANIQGQKKDELGQGKGFLSFRDPACVKLARASHTGKIETKYDEITGEVVTTLNNGVQTVVTAEEDCPVKTPGSVIAGALDTTLGSPTRQLELADEIGEILNAAFAQLTSQVLQQGLSTVSNKGSSGNSYLDTIVNDQGSDSINVNAIRSELLKNIDKDITNTKKYLTQRELAFTIVSNIKNTYDSTIACYTTKIASSTLSPNQTTIAQSRISNITTLLASASSTFTTIYAQVQLSYQVANSRYNQLISIQNRARAASTTSQINGPALEYGQILSDQITVIDIQNATDDVKTITTSAETFANNADALLRQCQGFPANLTN